jgi:hypothetical protein
VRKLEHAIASLPESTIDAERSESLRPNTCEVLAFVEQTIEYTYE